MRTRRLMELKSKSDDDILKTIDESMKYRKLHQPKKKGEVTRKIVNNSPKTNNNNSSIIGENNMNEIKTLLEKCLLE